MGPEALRAGGLGKHGARAARPRGALLERSGSGLAVFGEAGSRLNPPAHHFGGAMGVLDA